MPSAEEWKYLKLAVWGDGSRENPGLVRRFDMFETSLKAYWRAVAVFGTIIIALCMAILALLSYLGSHRANNTMVTHGSGPAVATYSEMR